MITKRDVAELGIRTLESIERAAEDAGHPFHGNQWTASDGTTHPGKPDVKYRHEREKMVNRPSEVVQHALNGYNGWTRDYHPKEDVARAKQNARDQLIRAGYQPRGKGSRLFGGTETEYSQSFVKGIDPSLLDKALTREQMPKEYSTIVLGHRERPNGDSRMFATYSEKRAKR